MVHTLFERRIPKTTVTVRVRIKRNAEERKKYDLTYAPEGSLKSKIIVDTAYTGWAGRTVRLAFYRPFKYDLNNPGHANRNYT